MAATMQTYKNHTKFDPPFHFVAVPVLFLNLIVSIYSTIRHWPDGRYIHVWWAVLSVALIVLAVALRGQALRAQDRVIRLEEHMRYHRMLGEQAHERYTALSLRQIIALRFASNEELAALSERAVFEDLSPKRIKESIIQWRPDTHRV